jgi:hypothetical protein
LEWTPLPTASLIPIYAWQPLPIEVGQFAVNPVTFMLSQTLPARQIVMLAILSWEFYA